MKGHIKEISDRLIWERFWDDHAPHAFFQSWLWGEAVKRRMLPVSRFGLYEGSALVGIAQVVTVRAKRGTYLHVRHGPIFESQQKRHWRLALAHLSALSDQERAWFVRISPRIEDSSAHRALFHSLGMVPSVIHEVDAERCLLVSLDKAEESILADMRKTTRYEIRKAQTLGVRVTPSINPDDLSKFFRLYTETSKRQHFVGHSGIREEFEVFSKERRAVLFFGYYQDVLSAAAMLLFSGDQAIYHHGASIRTKVPVSYAVQWEAMREAKRRGMKWYNFWGVAPEGNPTHPWYGHSLFKRGFGGTESVSIHAYDYPRSGFYNLTRAVEWVEERIRGY